MPKTPEIDSPISDESSERDQIQTRPRSSLAVLLFSTVGHREDVEEIADGITDVLVNTLSRTGMSEIADRSSTFSYKGRTPRPTDVSKALGVQYVLQGTIQRSATRVRVTAELFDADAKRHVWSDRVVRTFEDVFEVQDDIAKTITQSVRTKIVWGADWEIGTDNFDAWLLNIQCVELYTSGSAEENRASRRLAEKAIELDPNYCLGPFNLGLTHWYDALFAWSKSPESSLLASFELAERMFDMYELEVFRWNYSFLGINLSLRGEHSKSVEFAEKQFDYLPDEGGGMGYLGWIHCLSGDPKRARTLLEQSLSYSHVRYGTY